MLHLVNHNGGFFKHPTIKLSTIEMPKQCWSMLGYSYETALFSGGGNEIICTHETLKDAVDTHTRLSREYGLKNEG